MSDRDVTLRFNQEGAESVRTELAAIQAALAATPPTVDGLAAALQRLIAVEQQLARQHQQLGTATTSLTAQWRDARMAFQQGQAAGTGLAGTMGALGAAVSGTLAPLALLGLGLGLGISKMHEFNALAAQTYRELRQLSSVSGLSFEDAGALKGAFARAGVGDQTLSFAMNRLAVEAETNRGAFERMGIGIEGAGGRAKNAGQLFLELHDKINQLSDANERANARRTFFGRAGSGEIAPIFDKSSAELGGLIEKSREFANFSPELEDRIKKLADANAALADRQREVKLAFAETITLPVEQWLTGIATAAQNAGARIRASLRIAGGWGSLGAQFVGKQSAQDLLDSEEQNKRIEATIRKGEAARKRAAEERATAAEGGGTLSPDQARTAEARVRIQFEQQQKLLQGEAAYRAEVARARDADDIQAIQEQIRFTEETVRLAEERFAALLAIEQRATPKGGSVPSDVMTKLAKERDDVTIAGQEQLKLLYVKANQAMAASDQQRVSDAIRLERDSSEQRLAIIDNFGKQELAMLRATSASEVAVTLETAQIELNAARQMTAERLRQNALETQAITDLAARKAALGINTRSETTALADLAKQRVLIELDANTKIIESRNKLIEQMDALARREAQIGRQAVQDAIASLLARRNAEQGPQFARDDFDEAQRHERDLAKQRGDNMADLRKKQADAAKEFDYQQQQAEDRKQRDLEASKFSKGDVMAELSQMLREAREGAATFEGGGSITPEVLAKMTQMADRLTEMATLGTTAPGQAMMQQIQAALAGITGKFVPTALQGLDPVTTRFATATDRFSEAVARFAGGPSIAPGAPGLPGTPGIPGAGGAPASPEAATPMPSTASAWAKAREAAAAAWGGGGGGPSTPDTSGADVTGRSAAGAYGRWPAMPDYQSRFVPGTGGQPPTWAMTNTGFAGMGGERGFGNVGPAPSTGIDRFVAAQEAAKGMAGTRGTTAEADQAKGVFRNTTGDRVDSLGKKVADEPSGASPGGNEGGAADIKSKIDAAVTAGVASISEAFVGGMQAFGDKLGRSIKQSIVAEMATDASRQ